jgi:hypothetical protein
MRSDGLPRSRLAGGQSDRSGHVALAGVHHRPAAGAPGRQQRPMSARWRTAAVTSLPSAGAEAAGLDEVALHVDDDQRGVARASV